MPDPLEFFKPKPLPVLASSFDWNSPASDPRRFYEPQMRQQVYGVANQARQVADNAPPPQRQATQGGMWNPLAAYVGNEYAKWRDSIPQGMSAPPTDGAGGTGRRTWRDVGHEQIDSKMGAGYSAQFQGGGISPLDFYSDKRNWFPYQRDAAMDYGVDSKEFANATIRAVIDEGMKHAQEIAMWREKHGDTEIPQEMWQNWYYINRYGNEEGRPVVW